MSIVRLFVCEENAFLSLSIFHFLSEKGKTCGRSIAWKDPWLYTITVLLQSTRFWKIFMARSLLHVSVQPDGVGCLQRGDLPSFVFTGLPKSKEEPGGGGLLKEGLAEDIRGLVHEQETGQQCR